MTVSEPCGFWKEAPINHGHGEIRECLPLDQHLVVNQVIASRKPDHPHVEPAASLHGIEQCRRSFGVIDVKPMNGTRHSAVRSGLRVAVVVRNACSQVSLTGADAEVRGRDK